MFAWRASYLVVAELFFLIGVVLGQWLPFNREIFGWLIVSLVLITVSFTDRRAVAWLALFFIALWAGLAWRHVLGDQAAWQLPQLKVFEYLQIAKARFVGFFLESLPSPLGNLVSSVVVGGRGLLSYELRQAFIVTGTIHLTAVSGFNLTIVIKLLSDWLKVFSPRVTFLIGSILIFGFAVAVGGQASIVRAAILGWLFLVGRFIGRQASAFPALMLAATLMVVHRPSILMHDIGFQLSFLAFLGLVYISPVIRQGMARYNNVLPQGIVTILAETLGAQIAVLPLLLFHFGRLAPLSPIVNFLLLPIVPTLTITAIAVGFVGAIVGQLAAPLTYLVYPLAWYILKVVEWFASLPVSNVTIEIWPWWLTAIAYLSMYLIVSHFHKKLGQSLEARFGLARQQNVHS